MILILVVNNINNKEINSILKYNDHFLFKMSIAVLENDAFID